MICHVSIQHIHPRRVMHSDNSRGFPNAPGRGGTSRNGVRRSNSRHALELESAQMRVWRVCGPV